MSQEPSVNLFWGGNERTQGGEHSYTPHVKTTYNCGAPGCGINLPEGTGMVRCFRGHKNDLTKVGSHIRDHVG